VATAKDLSPDGFETKATAEQYIILDLIEGILIGSNPICVDKN
jgi:hypothetical protein